MRAGVGLVGWLCLAAWLGQNDVEASGYAAAMVDVFNEPVYLAELYVHDANPPVVWRDGVMHVRDEQGDWQPIRAAFRYVTQKPWQRIPLHSRTLILNPIVACLAGGRNKMIADKAYEFFNRELNQSSCGLQIRTPETVRDVSKSEIPLWLKSMGGHAVIKIPYSNAGQGVYTITNQSELDAFMAEEHHYDKFIVQSLVSGTHDTTRHDTTRHDTTRHDTALYGPNCGQQLLASSCPSAHRSFTLFCALLAVTGGQRKLGDELSQSPSPLSCRYATPVSAALALVAPSRSRSHPPYCHCSARAVCRGWLVSGTIPNKRLETFVCDLRCMISSTPTGFQPLAVYARRALLPLKPTLASADDSWQMLGTNLSIKKADGSWTTDTSRLLLMDCKDFNRLGIGIDDLIEAYVQTVLATCAIDRMASRLTSGQADGHFDRQLYASLNNDHSLLDEILQ